MVKVVVMVMVRINVRVRVKVKSQLWEILCKTEWLGFGTSVLW